MALGLQRRHLELEHARHAMALRDPRDLVERWRLTNDEVAGLAFLLEHEDLVLTATGRANVIAHARRMAPRAGGYRCVQPPSRALSSSARRWASLSAIFASSPRGTGWYQSGSRMPSGR